MPLASKQRIPQSTPAILRELISPPAASTSRHTTRMHHTSTRNTPRTHLTTRSSHKQAHHANAPYKHPQPSENSSRHPRLPQAGKPRECTTQTPTTTSKDYTSEHLLGPQAETTRVRDQALRHIQRGNRHECRHEMWRNATNAKSTQPRVTLQNTCVLLKTHYAQARKRLLLLSKVGISAPTSQKRLKPLPRARPADSLTQQLPSANSNGTQRPLCAPLEFR